MGSEQRGGGAAGGAQGRIHGSRRFAEHLCKNAPVDKTSMEAEQISGIAMQAAVGRIDAGTQGEVG